MHILVSLFFPTLPYIIDLRDLWTASPTNPFIHRSPFSKLRFFFISKIEYLIFSRASAFITVSPSYASHLSSMYNKPSCVVFNSLSNAQVDHIHSLSNSVTPNSSTTSVVISYAGSVYSNRDIISILTILAQNNPQYNITFQYMGSCPESYFRTLKLPNLELDYLGTVSQDDAYRNCMSSSVNISIISSLSTNDLSNYPENGILTGKLFEAFEFPNCQLVVTNPSSDVYHLPYLPSHLCIKSIDTLSNFKFSSAILSHHKCSSSGISVNHQYSKLNSQSFQDLLSSSNL